MPEPDAIGATTVAGRNRWQVAHADRAAIIIDADAYFRVARDALMAAKHQILLVGWDFDARINLISADEDMPDDAPRRIGALILWLVDRNPALEVYLLRWDVGVMKSLLRGTTLLQLARWMMHPRIHTRLDGHHPTAASHHQKIVVIDDCLAFCGGIDITSGRWDTRDHRDDDSRRVAPHGRPKQPWHDATSALAGAAAKALGDLCRNRWALAGGCVIAPPPPRGACWPPALTADFTDVDVAISRSSPRMPDQAPVREIETLYLDLIAGADRHIYAESQYFASRRIAEALARRLAEPDGPEIVIINPQAADGWLEPIAMDSARARLFQALKQRDRHDRLRLYHPVTAGRTPIYVHAKIMVIDDLVLRIGSSNFNNRSLRLDTECDITIDGRSGANADRVAAIRAIRDGLIAEHLGCTPAAVSAAIDETGSLIATIDRLAGPGRSLIPYRVPDLSAVEAFLADNEVLDPEGPEEMFEPLARRGLLRRLSRRRQRR